MRARPASVMTGAWVSGTRVLRRVALCVVAASGQLRGHEHGSAQREDHGTVFHLASISFVPQGASVDAPASDASRGPSPSSRGGYERCSSPYERCFVGPGARRETDRLAGATDGGSDFDGRRTARRNSARKAGRLPRPRRRVTENSGRARRRLQLAFFLVIWPAGNLLMISSALYDVGLLQLESFGTAALRLWLISGPSLLVIRFVERTFPELLHPDHFFRQGFVHVVVVVGFALLTGAVVQPPASLPRPSNLLVPRLVVVLEVVLYVSVLRILRLQETRLRDGRESSRGGTQRPSVTEQSPLLVQYVEPHHVRDHPDPEHAREIVYDLADLLRSNMKMAKQTFTTLGDELALVSLYLALQKRRFDNRLTYALDVAPETERVEIPALLLQPVIENTVKWAVAPYAAPAHVTVASALVDDRLRIEVSDTGPRFDETKIVERDGFRILRKTLELHYSTRFEMALRSTGEGGVFSLVIPVTKRRSS